MSSAATKGHNAPCSNRDFDFFYRGLEANRLLVQRCADCGTLRSLPSPGCGACGSLDWNECELAGDGMVHSYVIHHHPPLPGFATPLPIALVDMSEGVRILGAMDETDPATITAGLRVKVEFVRRGDIAAFRFRGA